MNNKRGFTLVELLAVIIILGIILAIAVPKVLNVVSSQKQEGLKNSAVAVYKTLENHLSMYALGLTPTILDDSANWVRICPTTAWNGTTDAACKYNYTAATGITSLQVQMTAVPNGKFNGVPVYTYTGTN